MCSLTGYSTTTLTLNTLLSLGKDCHNSWGAPIWTVGECFRINLMRRQLYDISCVLISSKTFISYLFFFVLQVCFSGEESLFMTGALRILLVQLCPIWSVLPMTPKLTAYQLLMLARWNKKKWLRNRSEQSFQTLQSMADDPEILFSNSPTALWFKIAPPHSFDKWAFTS